MTWIKILFLIKNKKIKNVNYKKNNKLILWLIDKLNNNK